MRIAKELESDDPYKTHYLTAKMKISRIMSSMHEDTVKISSNIYNKLLFQILANELVKSFPPTGENYEKAIIASLKNRFGRDDMIVEFYVRELLSLKIPLTSIYIYDKMECYIRALETLGVTSDKCAVMLYPPLGGQRSGQREITEANSQRETTDRLTKLFRFLQIEVENEERIDMALTGFRLSTEHEKVKKPKSKVEPSKEMPSANVLFVSKEPRKLECIFCNSNHENHNYENVRKLTLTERKTLSKEKIVALIA
ncbi:hypothetical protein P5V15_015880 [Pogonomyrmex californicus]